MKERITIKRITEYTPEMHGWFEILLRQLSYDRKIVDKKILKKSIASPNTYLFGLFDNKKLIGTGTLIVMNTFASQRGYVHDLVVDRKYRERGLGNILMNKIIKTAEELKLADLNLSSKPHRKTQEFFKSFGFRKRNTNCYRMNFSA